MKTIRRDSKLAVYLINRYWNTENIHLSDVYHTWSQAKERAWNECYNEYCEENGNRFRIISSNCMKFTVMWQCGPTYRVETAENSYLIV